jgi:hypothetical protein
MITQEMVNAAFDTLLQTVTGFGDIHVDDGSFYEPNQTTPYVVGKLSAYQRVAAGFGRDAVVKISGSYTVTIMRPTIEGRQTAGQMAGQMLTILGRGTTVALGTNLNVTISNSSEKPPMVDTDWITVPVVAEFFGSDP